MVEVITSATKVQVISFVICGHEKTRGIPGCRGKHLFTGVPIIVPVLPLCNTRNLRISRTFPYDRAGEMPPFPLIL
jgi:hypothetical protein